MPHTLKRELQRRELKQVDPASSDGRAGPEQTTSLPGEEFVARYMQHVLPRGFMRIRYYGLLSNGHRQKRLARCRVLLGVASDAPHTDALAPHTDALTPHTDALATSPAPAESKGVAHLDPAACPRCRRGRLVLFESWPRLRGWPWQSRGCTSVVPERHKSNTESEFPARPPGESITQRSCAAVDRDTS